LDLVAHFFLPSEEGSIMKAFLILLVLLVAGVVGLGFYEGWFHLSTGGADHKPSATISVDENKMQEDKKKAEGLGDKAKDSAADPTDKTKEQQPRP
jgi:hypothetical protein